MQGIYQIRNKVNGRHYIGSSVDIEARLYEHQRQLQRNEHVNLYLQRAWNKYGKENFTFELVEEIEDVKNIRKREQELLDNGFQRNILYNISLSATAPMEGRKPWNKGKIGVMHAWNKGKHLTEETKNKIGKTITRLHKCGIYNNVGKKVSYALKGCKHSEQWNQKISEGQKGRNAWNKGITHTDETKELLRRISKEWHRTHVSGRKGKKNSSSHNQKIAEANSRIYPALYNIYSHQYIEAGRNMSELCRKYNLRYFEIRKVVLGAVEQSKSGWRLA